MKKLIIKYLIISIIVTLPVTANATTGTGWQYTKQVYTYLDGTTFIRLNPASSHVNPAGCTNTYYLSVEPSQLNHEKIYQMALTAHAAKLKVYAYVSDIECNGSYPKILALQILNEWKLLNTY